MLLNNALHSLCFVASTDFFSKGSETSLPDHKSQYLRSLMLTSLLNQAVYSNLKKAIQLSRENTNPSLCKLKFKCMNVQFYIGD